MTPVQSLVTAMATALANTPPLDQVAADNRVGLVMAPFTPSPSTAYADLVLATFTGATPKVVALGAQGSAQDPVSNQMVITIVEPLGGWRFVTSDAVNLPQTIYGYALFDSTGGPDLLASQLLPEPITLVAAGQEINLDTVKLTMVLTPLS
jgi:hypothetical protein